METKAKTDIHGLCGIKAVATDDHMTMFHARGELTGNIPVEADAWEYVETAKGVLDKLSDDLNPIGINNFAMAMIHVINSGYYGKSNE